MDRVVRAADQVDRVVRAAGQVGRRRARAHLVVEEGEAADAGR